jgi:lipopolysaccharide export system protein LptA
MKIPTVNAKLAKRDFVPLLAGLSGFAANPGGDTPCGRSLWERARREGNGHGNSLLHHQGRRFAMTVKLSLFLCLWTALLLVATPRAHAETADRNKPINLEADTATVDDAKKISIYEGNVILTQGTLQIRANKLVVTEDAEGFQLGTAYGNPASFRQKREGYDEYIEGYGLRIEYDSRKELVQLFTQARMKRGLDEARGNYISYDGKTEFFQVLGGKETATPTEPRGRVRTVIQPKKKNAAPAAGPATLKPAESIANPREE